MNGVVWTSLVWELVVSSLAAAPVSTHRRTPTAILVWGLGLGANFPSRFRGSQILHAPPSVILHSISPVDVEAHLTQSVPAEPKLLTTLGNIHLAPLPRVVSHVCRQPCVGNDGSWSKLRRTVSSRILLEAHYLRMLASATCF